MEVGKRHLSLANGSFHFDDRIQRCQRNAHIGGMHCHTLVAGSKQGVYPVNTCQCSTACVWFSFVAGEGGVIVVGAARPLQQVAAYSRNIANLLRRSEQNRTREHGRRCAGLRDDLQRRCC